MLDINYVPGRYLKPTPAPTLRTRHLLEYLMDVLQTVDRNLAVVEHPEEYAEGRRMLQERIDKELDLVLASEARYKLENAQHVDVQTNS
jgi:hypothetical protein